MIQQFHSGYLSKANKNTNYFLKVVFIFSERERREKEKERNVDVWEPHRLVASYMLPAGGLACNPGMCPDWESNQQPFGFQPALNPLSHTS